MGDSSTSQDKKEVIRRGLDFLQRFVGTDGKVNVTLMHRALQRAETERDALRGGNKWLRAENERLEKRVAELEAENERMREALKAIEHGAWNRGTHSRLSVHRFARAALEGREK